jgi:hypothetical protein
VATSQLNPEYTILHLSRTLQEPGNFIASVPSTGEVVFTVKTTNRQKEMLIFRGDGRSQTNLNHHGPMAVIERHIVRNDKIVFCESGEKVAVEKWLQFPAKKTGGGSSSKLSVEISILRLTF